MPFSRGLPRPAPRVAVEAREAVPEASQLFFGQQRLEAGKDLVLFEPYVVVEQLAERGQLRFEVSICSQARGQLFNASPNDRMLGQHAHHRRLRVEGHVAGEGGQQHLFFFAEVQPAGGLPETEVVAGDAAHRGAAVAGRLSGGAADEQRLHQSVVVVLAECVQAGVPLHRPRWYYFFRVRT